MHSASDTRLGGGVGVRIKSAFELFGVFLPYDDHTKSVHVQEFEGSSWQETLQQDMGRLPLFGAQKKSTTP